MPTVIDLAKKLISSRWGLVVLALAVGLLVGRCSAPKILTSTEKKTDEHVQQSTNTTTQQNTQTDTHSHATSEDKGSTTVSRDKDEKTHTETTKTTTKSPDGTETVVEKTVVDDVLSDDVNVDKKNDKSTNVVRDSDGSTSSSAQQQTNTTVDLRVSEKTVQTLATNNVLVGFGVGVSVPDALKGNITPRYSVSVAGRVLSLFGHPLYLGVRVDTDKDVELNIQGGF